MISSTLSSSAMAVTTAMATRLQSVAAPALHHCFSILRGMVSHPASANSVAEGYGPSATHTPDDNNKSGVAPPELQPSINSLGDDVLPFKCVDSLAAVCADEALEGKHVYLSGTSHIQFAQCMALDAQSLSFRGFNTMLSTVA
jgi:hypothetical protein